MSIHLPGPVAAVLDFLGMHLPEGDEDQLYARGEHYKRAASKAHGRVGELERIKALVDRSLEGPAGEAALADIERDLKNLRQDAANLEQLAAQCHECAEAIEHTKYVIIGMVAALVIQAGFAIFSGVGTLAEAFAIARTRLAIGAALRALVAKLAENVTGKVIVKALAKEAAVGAGFGAAMDAGAQGVQIAQGHRDRLDLKSAATSALEGGVAGGVGGGIATKFHGIAGAAASGLGGAVAANATDAALTGSLDHFTDGLAGNTALGAMTGLAGHAHMRDAIERAGGTEAPAAPHSGRTETDAPAGTRGEPRPATSAGEHADEHAAKNERPEAPAAAPHEPEAQRAPAAETGHEQQQAHESMAAKTEQPQAAVGASAERAAEQRPAAASAGERANSSAEPQRPATAQGEPVRAPAEPARPAPAGLRAPEGPSLTGERPAPAAPRSEAPLAALSRESAATAGQQHAGAAAELKHEPAAAKTTDGAAPRTGEHVKATAETAPTAERHPVPALDRHTVDPVRAAEPAPLAEARTTGDHVAPERQAPAPLHLPDSRPVHIDRVLRGEAPIIDPRAATDLAVYKDHLPAIRDFFQHLENHPRGEHRLTAKGLLVSDEMAHAWRTIPEIRESYAIAPKYLDHFNVRDLDHALSEDPRNQTLRLIHESAQPVKLPDGRVQTDVLLLGWDHDGRAVIALDDPSQATHVGYLMPGTGTDVTKLAGYRERGLLMQESALDAFDSMGDISSSVSVVVCQNYHAPQQVWNATRSHYAMDGARPLNLLMEGLYTSHTGGERLATGVPHSYGSVWLGEAAKLPGGARLDRVLTLAGAGLRVPSVHDFRLTGKTHAEVEANFFAAMDQGDVLNVLRAAEYMQWMPSFGHQIGHGPMPHRPQFEAQPSAVEQHDTPGWRILERIKNHSGYWNLRTLSLENQGRVLAGYEPLPNKSSGGR